MRRSASDLNHLIVNKIVDAFNELRPDSKLKLCDISYLKYQLLKKHDSYELLEMKDNEFKKEVKRAITGSDERENIK